MAKQNYQQPGSLTTTYADIARGTVDDIQAGVGYDEILDRASSGNLSSEKGSQFEQLALQRALQLDDRAYNDPSAQLARLVAAGMSPQAAMAILSGGSQAAPGEVPQPQMTPEAQTGLQVFQGVASIAQTVLGAAQFGMTVPQIRANNYIAQNAATLSAASMRGFQVAGQVFSTLDNAMQSGVLSRATYDSIKSAPEAVQFIRDHAEEVPEFMSLVSSGVLDQTASDSLSMSAMNTAWREYRATSDYARNYDLEVQRQVGFNRLQQVQFDKLSAEIPQVLAQTQLTYADINQRFVQIDLIKEQTNTERKQQGLISAQTGLTRQQTATEVENTKQAEASARIRSNEAEISDLGQPMLKQITVDQLEVEVAKWSQLNTPEARQKAAEAWAMQNADNAYLLALISNTYANAEVSSAGDIGNIVGIGKVLDSLGLHSWISDAVIASGSFLYHSVACPVNGIIDHFSE